MTKIQFWSEKIKSLPASLTQTQAGKFLKLKSCTVRLWLLRFGYKSPDGREIEWPESRRAKRRIMNPAKVDWSQTNLAIAKKYGISRERVRQVRSRLGVAKVGGRK
jgi:hypothetical protein